MFTPHKASLEAAQDGTLEKTFPRLLFEHARLRPKAPAMREKYLGIWQTWTWEDVAERVRALACGLALQGFKRGDHLAIIGDNRPHLYMAMAAAQCLGGIPVPLYQDGLAQEIGFILENAGVRFAVVENQEQVDKLLEIHATYPLQHIIYDDPRGMRHYNQPFIHDIHELMEMGRVHDRNHTEFLNAEIAQGRRDDTAVMLYTSGTTGNPKGVCQTHHAFTVAAEGGVAVDGLSAGGEVLSYLPMAWVGDHLFSYAQALVAGLCINCPESPETVLNDLREIGPTFYFAPPRVFEGLLTSVMIRMEDAARLKQRLFHYFMDVARRCGSDLLDGKPVSAANRLLYRLGDFLVYSPLRNVLGMSRVRVAYTAGAAIGPDLFRFYRSIGINLKQFYGQTETCAYVCLQPNGHVKLDSVGQPAPKVEIRIAGNGEVMVRGPMLFKEYYRRPEDTAACFDQEGFFHTGDAGFLDAEGHLKIVDRAKDVGQLANGAMFAPNYIENKLKFFQYIKEAVCFGNGRDKVCAFINIDMEAVGNWAERKGIPYSSYTDLAGKAEVRELIAECVGKVNLELRDEAMVADSQIHRFLVLHKELDPDDDELTRTRKVRRGFVLEKYKVLVDALYDGASHQYIETEVKFEDGRKGKIAADLQIVDVPTFAIRQKEVA